MNDLLEKGAVLQRDKETYAIAPHIPAGLITSGQLRKLADDKVLELVDEIISIYSNNANNKQRLGSYIDSIGFDRFKSMINLDKYFQ